MTPDELQKLRKVKRFKKTMYV